MSEQEELLRLRELVEKQEAEIEKQKLKISNQEDLLTKKNAQIENLTQALLQARKKLFGASTEVSKQLEGQIHLFATIEDLTQETT